jgi:dTDP-4-dehydrorhamnose 3,5-epimerase
MEPMIVKPEVFADNRGNFREVVNMGKVPWSNMYFAQQNISINKKNVWRGLHYQHENPQGKLVTVLRGAVYDYIVDLRLRSSNFGKVRKYHLTSESGDMLWVPPCFAHGFLSLEANTYFMYNVFDSVRVPDDEYSLTPLDFPEIKYDLDSVKIIMSEKDAKGLHLKDAPIYE